MLKPWGMEELIESNDVYAVKRIHYAPGHRTSLQRHDVKRETLVIIAGAIDIEVGGSTWRMEEGDQVTIQPGQVHRMTGGQPDGGTALEISSPELDDLVRLEDDYGRV